MSQRRSTLEFVTCKKNKLKKTTFCAVFGKWLHSLPPSLENSPTFLYFFPVFILSAWHVEALLVLAGAGGLKGYPLFQRQQKSMACLTYYCYFIYVLFYLFMYHVSCTVLKKYDISSSIPSNL